MFLCLLGKLYLPREKIKLYIILWSRLQQKYNVSHNTVNTALIGKGRPGGSQYQQKRKRSAKQEPIATTSSCQTPNIKFCYIVGIPFTMMTFVLSGLVYFFGNILLAWLCYNILICPKLFVTPPQNKNDWYTQLFLNLNQNAINKIILQNDIIFRFPTLFARFSISR